MSTPKEKKGGREKLDPGGGDTVLIGFKGPKNLQEDVKFFASRLGISYSQFLRSSVEEAILQMKKQMVEHFKS